MSLDLAELTWGRYNGGQVVAIGSYVNLRTLCVAQSTSDQTLPADGTFCRVAPLGNESLATLATAINAVLSTNYTSGSLHSCAGGDNVFSPGQPSTDA
jgi:hypothetical protein